MAVGLGVTLILIALALMSVAKAVDGAAGRDSSGATAA
jgi:hypothetical protein